MFNAILEDTFSTLGPNPAPEPIRTPEPGPAGDPQVPDNDQTQIPDRVNDPKA